MSSPTQTNAGTAVPRGSPTVHDRTVKPSGSLPRHLQTWVVAGIALLMTGVIALSGPSRPAEKKPATTTAAIAVEPNDGRIQDYRRRIDEEARRLAAAQAELDVAKRAFTVSPQIETPRSVEEPVRT